MFLVVIGFHVFAVIYQIVARIGQPLKARGIQTPIDRLQIVPVKVVDNPFPQFVRFTQDHRIKSSGILRKRSN
jgi:hypothetical protein